MKLPLPENYTLPEDVADGDSFEELTTFRVEGDSLVPTMIAGVEIAADESEEDEMEDEAADEMEAGASPMAGMGERIMGMA
jgi:mannose/fructose/N-acetylgalactosamine-specific phosphotransferase system component IID